MERISIGVVTKPQALKGAFRLKPTLLNLKSYKKISTMFIGNEPYDVESVSIKDTIVIVKLKGIDTCDMAESLRGKSVFADVVLKTDDNQKFVGYTVLLQGQTLGKIISVDNFGSKDIFSVDGEKPFMIPVIDDLIDKIDEENLVIEFSKIIFEQVVVYEN